MYSLWITGLPDLENVISAALASIGEPFTVHYAPEPADDEPIELDPVEEKWLMFHAGSGDEQWGVIIYRWFADEVEPEDTPVFERRPYFTPEVRIDFWGLQGTQAHQEKLTRLIKAILERTTVDAVFASSNRVVLTRFNNP